MTQQIFLNKSSRKCFLLISLLLMSATRVVLAQTNVFTYQGKLSDNGNPANGNYDLQFKLYAAMTGGAEIGVRTRTNVPVTGGVFTVQLDFAVGAFSGLDRFLEIEVKPAGDPGGYQQLLPRQPITATPYAFHSLSSDAADAATTATTATNANQLGGVVASQYVLTTDTRMTDARAPTAGSPNYIQNSTSQQAASNFYISGNGTLGGTLSTFGAINTFGQYNIANSRVLSIAGTNNTFAGLNAGANNDNFFGVNNSFFGRNAGFANTTANNNSFFGYNAGGNSNACTQCGDNSFFGSSAGLETTGNDNSFVGVEAGKENTTGSDNTFMGVGAGRNNTTGSFNTALGTVADVGSGNLTHATAIGAEAVVNTSNTIVLGRDDGSDLVLVPGKLQIETLGTTGSDHLCINSSNRVAACSSSLRYKTNLSPYLIGLSIVNRLRPISFTWKDGGMRDLGFGAEDVEKIDPLLVTYNRLGQVEGVKYDRINVVLVNAIKEQQQQINAQQKQIGDLQVDLKRQQQLNEQLKQHQNEIDGLKKLVCDVNPTAELCHR